VLIPDFKGSPDALRTVLDARPDVLNHNIETVPRIFRQVRTGGRYERSLELLDRARQYAPDIPTKSGLMVGLGEEWDEVVGTLRDLRRVGVSIFTVGQYLRPSLANVPTVRYYHPDEFAGLRQIARDLGFLHAECGPLVRSSYHAHEQTQAYDQAMGDRR
jgi:lipoyl synthase